MKNLIKTTLNIPVYDPHETITFPSATVDVYKISADCFGDGSATSEQESVQIDLWYRSQSTCNASALTLRSALVQNFNITFPTINLSFDNTARCYRANITFYKRR